MPELGAGQHGSLQRRRDRGLPEDLGAGRRKRVYRHGHAPQPSPGVYFAPFRLAPWRAHLPAYHKFISSSRRARRGQGQRLAASPRERCPCGSLHEL